MYIAIALTALPCSWLGGVLYEATGSYDAIWWGSIILGVASAVINLPIVEKPVARSAVAAAA